MVMFRIPQILLSRSVFRTPVRHVRRSVQNMPAVKILSSGDEDFIKISFKYGNVFHSSNTLNFKVEKEQTLDEAIRRIKLMVNLQKKKEEIRRSVINKYSGTESVEEEDEADIEVSMMKDDVVLDSNMKNVDAWTEGTLLKIGDTVFEVNHNTPSILQLALPEFIISGCMIRPHIICECAEVLDCEYQWFREKQSEGGEGNEDDSENWVKVGESFMYHVLPEDVGHRLKLICTAKLGDRPGLTFSAVSKSKVEAGPDLFPFEERHQFTRDLADSDCVRVVSYNILASVYVESRRFPYSSKKARDSYYRKQLLLKELSGLNSDILCLQEVQERVFKYDLRPVLKKLDLHGFYYRKSFRRQEGVALFYRTTKFKLLERQCIHLNEIIKDKEIVNDLLTKASGNYKDMSKLLAQDTILQLGLLQHMNEPTKKVLVANTHLYSHKDMPEVRLIQAALCTSYAEYFLKSQEIADSTAIVFCGDFNSLPESATYEFITEGKVDCSSTWKNGSTMQDTDMNIHHNFMLASACGTPEYTNYTEEFNGCLDYIFYSTDKFTVSEVVPMPSHDKIMEQVALPSEFFPSDHIPLVCTLKWKTWNDTG